LNADETSFLPYGRHSVDEDDIAAVVAVLKSDWLTNGPVVHAFEQAFAEKTGAQHAIVCNSGTAGLHLAAMALGLCEGDVAIVPTMTFLATANAVRYVGAEVVFADVDPHTGLMGEGNLRDAFARSKGKARAILPVHLNGQCVDMAMVARLAQEYGLRVIEDACHALGGTYDSNGVAVPVGACQHGDMAVFSLHPVKTVTMGEGGVVTTNDTALYEKMLRLRNHGMVRDPAHFQNADLASDGDGEANPWYYEVPTPGYNFRASDINCALGLSQLAKLDKFVARRHELSARYDALLAPLAPMVRPIERMENCAPARHLYVVLVDFQAAGVERATMMARLKNHGIGTQVHYIPVHLQPYYRQRYGETELPGADVYYAWCLSLPLFPAMTDEEVDRVVGALEVALCKQ
jgi:UDP-4-amino-4,6-dideoxy-N-acetyl-beta-L-altrosamine transaminase